MIQAVIFDMDGLLIDSEPIWQETEVTVLKRFGIVITKEMAAQTIGLDTKSTVQYWLGKYPSVQGSAQELEDQIDQLALDLIVQKCKPLKGVNKVIALIDQLGIPMAVASSSTLNIIQAVLTSCKLGDKIHTIHSVETEKYGKPHPDVYLSAARSLGVDPAHCLVFEDSITGVIAARAANMHCIAVPDPADVSIQIFPRLTIYWIHWKR